MIVTIVFQLLLILCCLYAFLRGGGPERIAATVYLLGYLASIAAISPIPLRFSNIEIQMMIVDCMMLCVFGYLAMYANRFWTLWLCGMQIIQVMTHLPTLFLPELVPQAYGIVVAIWSIPMIAILTIGVKRHQGRLNVQGKDKSWSDF